MTQNFKFNPESVLLIGKPCKNTVDLPYVNAEGDNKMLKKGAKLTIFKVFGDRFILRWGTKMFFAQRDQLELI